MTTGSSPLVCTEPTEIKSKADLNSLVNKAREVSQMLDKSAIRGFRS